MPRTRVRVTDGLCLRVPQGMHGTLTSVWTKHCLFKAPFLSCTQSETWITFKTPSTECHPPLSLQCPAVSPTGHLPSHGSLCLLISQHSVSSLDALVHPSEPWPQSSTKSIHVPHVCVLRSGIVNSLKWKSLNTVDTVCSDVFWILF